MATPVLKKGTLTEEKLANLKLSELRDLFDREFREYPGHRPFKSGNKKLPWIQALLFAQRDWLKTQRLKEGIQLSLFDFNPEATATDLEPSVTTASRGQDAVFTAGQYRKESDKSCSQPADSWSATAFVGEPPASPESAPLPPAPPDTHTPVQLPVAPQGPDGEDEIIRGVSSSPLEEPTAQAEVNPACGAESESRCGLSDGHCATDHTSAEKVSEVGKSEAKIVKMSDARIEAGSCALADVVSVDILSTDSRPSSSESGAAEKLLSSTAIVTIVGDSLQFGRVQELWDSHRYRLGFLPKVALLRHANKGEILGYLEKEKCLGFLLFGSSERRKKVTILGLCVSEEFRGRGIARELVEAFKKAPVTQNKEIWLHCRKDYELDVFWKNLGFIAQSERPAKTKNKAIVSYSTTIPAFADSVAIIMSPTEVCAHLEKWEFSLQMADSRQTVEDISNHYQALFPADYEDRKKQVWSRLDSQAKDRLRQLMTPTVPAPAVGQEPLTGTPQRRGESPAQVSQIEIIRQIQGFWFKKKWDKEASQAWISEVLGQYVGALSTLSLPELCKLASAAKLNLNLLIAPESIGGTRDAEMGDGVGVSECEVGADGGVAEKLLAIPIPERLEKAQQLIAKHGLTGLRKIFKAHERCAPYLEQLLESAISHLRAYSVPQRELPSGGSVLLAALPKGKERPITPYALLLSERRNPYVSPRLFAFPVLYATESTVRLKGGSFLFPEDFTAHHHKVFCLPGADSWKKALSLQSRFERALRVYEQRLVGLVNYSTEFARAGGLSELKSPLAPTVVRAWECPGGVEFCRRSESQLFGPYFVPRIERVSVYRHTRAKLQPVGEDQKSLGELMPQVDFWLCPDDAAWEALKAARDAASQVSRELQQFLCTLGTYREALADKRYAGIDEESSGIGAIPDVNDSAQNISPAEAGTVRGEVVNTDKPVHDKELSATTAHKRQETSSTVAVKSRKKGDESSDQSPLPESAPPSPAPSACPASVCAGVPVTEPAPLPLEEEPHVPVIDDAPASAGVNLEKVRIIKQIKRHRLLDLFCGGGGAGEGYYRAGYEVVGVDCVPQPDYPFAFVQADALEFLQAYWEDFDLIHASPPCQFASSLRFLSGKTYPNLLEPTLELLRQLSRPYIVENVEGAACYMRNPLLLCGEQFGLQTFRHRVFEIGGFAPFLLHRTHSMLASKQGRPPEQGKAVSPAGHFSGVEAAREIMDIAWLGQSRLSQAIPPAYTQWLGQQAALAFGWELSPQPKTVKPPRRNTAAKASAVSQPLEPITDVCVSAGIPPAEKTSGADGPEAISRASESVIDVEVFAPAASLPTVSPSVESNTDVHAPAVSPLVHGVASTDEGEAGEATRAISIQQPWAWAIFHCGKDVENRSWPTKFRGKLAIHCGKGYDDLGRAYLEARGFEVPADLHRGCLLGTVNVTDCIQDSLSLWAIAGQFHFLLSEAVEWRSPVPFKGKMGIFSIESDSVLPAEKASGVDGSEAIGRASEPVLDVEVFAPAASLPAVSPSVESSTDVHVPARIPPAENVSGVDEPKAISKASDPVINAEVFAPAANPQAVSPPLSSEPDQRMMSDRHPWDFYESPAWYALVALQELPLSGTVFEPCAGDGAISSVLASAKLSVTTNDLNKQREADYHFDATGSWENFPPADWVVTNPPFGEAFAVLTNAWNHAAVGVALFLRQSFTEPTTARGEWLSAHPPALQIDLPRFKFRRGKNGAWATDSNTISLFVWLKRPVVPSGRKILTRKDIPLFYQSPAEAPDAKAVTSEALSLTASRRQFSAPAQLFAESETLAEKETHPGSTQSADSGSGEPEVKTKEEMSPATVSSDLQFPLGQRVAVQLKGKKRIGTVCSEPYRVRGIDFFFVQAQICSHRRSVPLEDLVAITDSPALKEKKEGAGESSPALAESQQEAEISPESAGKDETPGLEPAPAEGRAGEKEVFPVLEVSLVEKWKRELEEARTPESVRLLAARYREECGKAYDEAKAKVWQTLEPEVQERIRGLMKSEVLQESPEVRDKVTTELTLPSFTPASDFFREYVESGKIHPPRIPEEAAWLLVGTPVKTWSGKDCYKFGIVAGPLSYRVRLTGFPDHFYVWRVPVQWRNGQIQELDPSYLDALSVEEALLFEGNAEVEVSVTATETATAEETEPGEISSPTEAQKAIESAVERQQDCYGQQLSFLPLLLPEGVPSSPVLPENTVSVAAQTDSSSYENSNGNSKAPVVDKQRESKPPRNKKQESLLLKWRKKAEKYHKLVRVAARMGCRQSAAKWLIEALKWEHRIELESSQACVGRFV